MFLASHGMTFALLVALPTNTSTGYLDFRQLQAAAIPCFRMAERYLENKRVPADCCAVGLFHVPSLGSHVAGSK